MKPVTSPNHPSKGTVRWNDDACSQFTSPAAIGANAEIKARSPDAVAIGIASLPAHFTPHRFTAAKNRTSVHDMMVTGTAGRYHSWMAAPEKIAVSPQVGTQPHQ